jgi:hypothetical protein
MAAAKGNVMPDEQVLERAWQTLIQQVAAQYAQDFIAAAQYEIEYYNDYTLADTIAEILGIREAQA